jgi:hypothetical protein
LVARLRTPCGDHRENQVPAVAEQRLIDARVELADGLGYMGEIELDGPWQHVSRSTNTGPFAVLNTFPGCGSP